MAAPSQMRRSASPRLVAPHTNGHREGPLVDVVRLVGRGQHLGLVDVVDAERLEDLGLDEVADAGLGHHRDGHGRLDALDHLRVAHAGHAAVAADVGRHPLERHDGDRAGVLGDLGLLGRDDVHDDAALQHLGQAALDRGTCRCGVVMRTIGRDVGHTAPDRTARLPAVPTGWDHWRSRLTSVDAGRRWASSTQVLAGRQRDGLPSTVGVAWDRVERRLRSVQRARRTMPPPVSTYTVARRRSSGPRGCGTSARARLVVDEHGRRRWRRDLAAAASTWGVPFWRRARLPVSAFHVQSTCVLPSVADCTAGRRR